MPVIKITGIDLSKYVDTDSGTKPLKCHSRTQTNREILIKTIECLPDEVIDEIFNENQKTE